MNDHIDLKALQSEGRNPRTVDIDVVDTAELCHLINEEDKAVPLAVARCLPVIAGAVDAITERVRRGGRLIYTGAGTSGRLGVLDASELPPTFSAAPEQFVAIIAGGDTALRNAVEGAEDDVEQAVRDLEHLDLNHDDCLIGIAASGRTPYVLSCLSYAKAQNCLTIGIACSSPSAMLKSGQVDHMIEAVAGAEVVSGSTRLKAGTATKLILNMLSTAVHIKLGKTYSNLMVDVKASNLKLKERARRIIRLCCASDHLLLDDRLDQLLVQCDGSVKLAIATLKLGVPVSEAHHRLSQSGGVLAKAIQCPINGAVAGRSDVPRTRYVICIDGGGSKCAVSILGSNGEAGSVTAAGCNVTTVETAVAVTLIQRAIEEAMEQCPSLRGRRIRSVSFAKVSIGLAGFDRPQVAAVLSTAFKSLFGTVANEDLVITNDLKLLAYSVGRANDKNICVLVAGTGSVAMSFEKTSQGYRQVARVGGWGSLLGDEGSGFDVGRQAVRHLLQSQETCFHRNDTVDGPPEDPLAMAVLRHLGLSDQRAGIQDTLAALLAPTSPGSADTKSKIAGIAKIVLELEQSSPVAADIVTRAISTLAGFAKRVMSSSGLRPAESVLVMTGGMMQHAGFRGRLEEHIAESGLRFERREVVLHAADFGANRLLEELC